MEEKIVTSVREAAVAGLFYPGDPVTLQQQVEAMLSEADGESVCPKALIVPHAGYIYSGPVAARAYRQLRGCGHIRKVILLGPAHRVAIRGLAASSADCFSTPLGRVQVDQAAVQRLLELPQVQVSDLAHREEHSLEVQLPFLQRVLPDGFTLVPVVVGDASAEEVAEVLERLWGGAETLILISSDLSHYHDYRKAQQLDSATSRAIEALDPGTIDYEQACGRIPVSGLLLTARQHHLKAVTLDQRNSGDTAGGRDRVVGYGAYLFS